MFSLFLALKYLKPKRAITSVVTILTICGVMLGVAIVIIVRAVMTGFGEEWEKTILSFKPHIVIQAESGFIYNEENRCTRLESIDGVLAASPSIQTRILLEYQRKIFAPIVIGTDSRRIQNLVDLKMVHGEFDLSEDGIVMGVDMARELGVKLNDEVLVYSPMNVINSEEMYLHERTYLRGIFDSGRSDFDTGYVFVSLPLGRDLLNMESGGSQTISVKVDEPQNMNRVEQIVSEIKGQLGPHFRISTWHEQDQMLFNALATEKNMLMLLMAFVTVVAMFCVANTLIVITVQKTNEIGLLKALGFSSRKIMMTFVSYGWIQCLLGTVFGVGLAFLVLYNIQNIITFLGKMGLEVFPKDIYGLAELPWKVTPGEVFQVVFLVIVFCSLASFLPAWRAARLDPVTALRKE